MILRNITGVPYACEVMIIATQEHISLPFVRMSDDIYLEKSSMMKCAPTLGLILRTFKALATRYLHAAGISDFAWQRNYYEHITRKEGKLDSIRQYIIENPNRWTKDSLYIEEA